MSPTYFDGSSVKLFEFFKANEHLSRYRYYLFSGYVVRQEQLDAKGRITRVITVNDWSQPRPGPKPDMGDRLLDQKALRFIGNQIYHRVHDVDAIGKPTLVALSWNRKMRLNPLKRTPMSSADLVYSTPDGKERRKTKADFEKYFDFSPSAVHVFPDVARGYQPAEI